MAGPSSSDDDSQDVADTSPTGDTGPGQSEGNEDRPRDETDDSGPENPVADDVESADHRGAGLSADDVTEYTTGERTLSPSVQLIWGVHALVTVTTVGVIAALVARWFDAPLSVVGGGILVLAVLVLVWVHLRHRVWAYRVREDSLYLERGVFTRVNTVVPYVRIQHVDTQRSPLERVLGLSTLVVYTAGSRGADVSVPGLTTEEAHDLQQRVKELAIEAEGGDAL